MKNLLTVAILIFFLSSCSHKKTEADAGELMMADSSFSDYSEKKWITESFY